MKKQLENTLTRIALVAVMAMSMTIGSAQGQTLSHSLTVNIPFDFFVADKKMPAGKYWIGRSPQHSDDTFLMISSLNDHVKSFRLTSRVETLKPKEGGTLVFHRYGDQYFLSQVWQAGESSGRMLFKSRREREMEQKAREAAGATAKKVQALESVNIVGGPQ